MLVFVFAETLIHHGLGVWKQSASLSHFTWIYSKHNYNASRD